MERRNFRREINPQAAIFGIYEYIGQSNDNADMINEEDRFKFVDDLTSLKIINLLCIQISANDIRSHVPSDIPVHNDYIKRELLQSQKNISLLNNGTKKKTYFEYEKDQDYDIQFYKKKQVYSECLKEDNANIEVVNEMKLLGTIITDDLKWESNTSYLTKKAYNRMQLLHNVSKYTKESIDLRTIYIT